MVRDTRLVQTAVIGDEDSDMPIMLPTEALKRWTSSAAPMLTTPSNAASSRVAAVLLTQDTYLAPKPAQPVPLIAGQTWAGAFLDLGPA